jgi:glycosyltransferase involved in cell wall biosynthesis
MKKRFSVIIAAYNRENYIRQTVDSVLSQEFKDYEIIVVDDGSTDRTYDMLQTYGERIRVIRQANKGSEMAYRAGVLQSNGEYMAFLDSDDIYAPYALATYDKIITVLDHPPLIIGSDKRLQDTREIQNHFSETSVIKILKYRDYLAKDIRISLSLSKIVIQKALFEKAYGAILNESPFFMNDFRLILLTGVYGPCVIVQHPTTVIYRQHEGMVSRNVEIMGQNTLQLINMVRNGRSPGGFSRLFDKYAFLGGPVSVWSRKALKIHRLKLAFRILSKGWMMVICNQINKFLFLFYSSSTPVDIEPK